MFIGTPFTRITFMRVYVYKFLIEFYFHFGTKKTRVNLNIGDLTFNPNKKKHFNLDLMLQVLLGIPSLNFCRKLVSNCLKLFFAFFYKFTYSLKGGQNCCSLNLFSTGSAGFSTISLVSGSLFESYFCFVKGIKLKPCK